MKLGNLPRPFEIYVPRRHFLRQLAFGSALFTVPGLFADQLVLTPRQTEGPFYPDKLPLDTDNDLVVLNDSLTPAVGEITWLSGRLLTAAGSPIRNATIEIWQCDSTGVYLHSKTGGEKAKRDANFQCFGRFVTGSTGDNRRICFPHDQARPLSWTFPAHSSRGETEGEKRTGEPVLHQRSPRE
jgi:hypothetical protein